MKRAIASAGLVLVVALNTVSFQDKKDWPLALENHGTVVLLLPLSLLALEETTMERVGVYGVLIKLKDGRVLIGNRPDWQKDLSPMPSAFTLDQVSRHRSYTEVVLRNFTMIVKLRFQTSISDVDAVFAQFVKGYDRASYPGIVDIVPDDRTYRYIFTMTKPAASDIGIYEDANIKAEFALSKSRFGFALSNKTDGPIRVDWNQIAYVDPLGDSHKVIHEGVRYMTRNETLPPSVVPPGARISDVIVPSDLVSLRSIGGWEVAEPLPGPEVGLKVLKLKGKTISFFIPLDIDGSVKNYNFVFSIDIGSEPKN